MNSGSAHPSQAPRNAERALVRLAVGASALLLALRLYAAQRLGFGESEALYACYAHFAQPAYLDHPGFIGQIGRWIADGSIPDPVTAHTMTAVWATLIPWLAGLASRSLGASARGGLLTVVAAIAAPELSIGLFGLTPDLPLATTWLGALGSAGVALRNPPRSLTTFGATLATGILVGVACYSKLSGCLLGVSLLATSLGAPLRARWRTLAPWLAVAAALLVMAPMVAWEYRQGWPMLQHRLINTQGASGFSLRNLGVFVGGQLLYVTPLYTVAAVLLWKRMWQSRHDVFTRLLLHSTVVAAVPLLALCLWSIRAEPHWFAPALLPVLVYVGIQPNLTRPFTVATLGSGAVATLIAIAWVTTPLAPRYLGAFYKPRFDLANDMYTWNSAAPLLVDSVGRTLLETGEMPPVVGPHWIVCAQARVALKELPHVRVGCNTDIGDDFDRWYPRATWQRSTTILFVYDSRFEVALEREFPERELRRLDKVVIRRGGVDVRTVRIATLQLRAALAARENPVRNATASVRGALGNEPSGLEHVVVEIGTSIRGGQQLFTVEDTIGPRVHAEELRLTRKLAAAGTQAHLRLGNDDARSSDHPQHIKGVDAAGTTHRSTLDSYERIDGDALGMRRERREFHKHRTTVLKALPQTKDSARTHANPRLANVPNRFQPVIVGARRHYFGVVLARGVEIVVVAV